MSEDKKEKNEVVKAEENLPAPVSNCGDGLDELDNDEMEMPRFVIVQPTSQEGTQGKFRNSLTDEEYDEIDTTFLVLKKSRVMFGNELGEDPLCRSNDSLEPSSDVDSPPCEVCAESTPRGAALKCPCAMWPNTYAKNNDVSIKDAVKACYAKGKTPNATADISKTPPACELSFNLIGVFNGLPYVIGFRRSALRNVRKFLSGCKARMSQTGDDLCQCKVTMALQKITGGNGVYYVPYFKNPSWLTKEESEEFRNMFDQFASTDVSEGGDTKAEKPEDKPLAEGEVPF